MNALGEFENNTMQISHINAVMSLISLMSSHYLVNSFILISNMETSTTKNFLEIGSKYYLQMSCKKSIQYNNLTMNGNKGYIVIGTSVFDFHKVIKAKPKLIAAVFKWNETNLISSKLLETVIPPTISFFIILLADDPKVFSFGTSQISGKCFRLYKPVPILSPKIFPMMIYGGPVKSQWIWEVKNADWNFYKKETRNLTGVSVTIALVSRFSRKKEIDNFWRNKNSFFWRAMKEHLHFRPLLHVQTISPQEVKSITSIYLTLLMTIADGLGVLPVISSERNQHLQFLITGLDSKYHLFVRAPQYVYSWQSILKPLAHESWICLGITIVLISITLRIVMYHQNFSTDLSNCFLVIFGFVCFQSCPNVPKGLSTRLVCYTALLFSILIYQFYTSNFYSLLSTKEAKLPFTSLEQFIAKRTHTLYVHPDTAIYAHVVKARNGTFKKLWDEFFKKDPSHQLKGETRGKSLSKVCKGTGAILGLPFQTLHLPELECKLVPVNSGYFPTNVVTVVRKNFPFKSQFMFVHLRLLEAGLSHKFRDEHLNLDRQHENPSDVINEPVSLEHILFLIAFHSGAIVLSWLILGLEIITSKIVKKNKIRKGDTPRRF